MPDLRLMTPEEMQGSRNPAAGEKMDYTKTPREYGIQFLQTLYRKLYDDFFGDNFPGYPEMVDFTFSESQDYLGRFICKHTEQRDKDGKLVDFEFSDPTIDFSTSFDLTPFELANVMAHEMVHLAQVVYASGDGFERMGDFASMDAALGHGDWFDKISEDVNSALDLAVTPVCDDPTLKNSGKPNYRTEIQYFIVKPAGQNECAVISVPDSYLKRYLEKNLAELDSIRIYYSKDANYIDTYGYQHEDSGRKTTVPLKMLNAYIASGVLVDDTQGFIGGLKKYCKLGQADTSQETPEAPETPEASEFASQFGGEQEEQGKEESEPGTYLMVTEYPERGLMQVVGESDDPEGDAREMAVNEKLTIYVYGVKTPENAMMRDGMADSGFISNAVKNGYLEPMFVVLPNGCKMQLS